MAFLSYERIPYESPGDADIPQVAPDVVVEVLSPRDLLPDIEEKVRVYLASGTTTVFLVDTDAKTVIARSADATRTFSDGDEISAEALPGFSLPLQCLFEEPRPRSR